MSDTGTKNTRPKAENTRRQQRTYAFQVLYALNFVSAESSLAATFNRFKESPAQDEETQGSFAWSLVRGVWDNLDELNRIIASYSRNWKIQRIARIELTIMRLAVYEMIYCPDIPLKVAINEAIELAKAFGDDNSRNFVNGILDAVAKDVRNGKFGTSKGF
ncbi:transcription antitermination factor NusB [Desulfonatronovibrio hydrogenovorans]|uniref:transcription antitermination factor NusB n=1 Tax=Desulfonatronovibrio hydrogenovorans TaxID=53245 RepID=UPI00048B4624